MISQRRQAVSWFLRVAVFLTLAGLATVFQLDRHSRTRLPLIAYVPPNLGGFADANVARLLAMQEPELALKRAESSLRHRPIDASTLSSFGLAAVEGDDPERAGRALSLAAQRGWRDTYTQVMVVGSAIDMQNWEAAALRIDALTRLRRDQAAIFGSISLMLRSEGGRRALAERLDESYPLTYAMADFIGEYPEYGEEVSRVFGLSEGMECSRYSRVTRTLLARNAGGEAISVWPERCLDEASRKISFAKEKSEDDPFLWSYPSYPGLSVKHRGELLTVRNRDPLRRQFARRYTILVPGQYNLRLEHEMGAGGIVGRATGQASLQVTMRCERTSRAASNFLIRQKYDEEITFEVPEDCPTQFLTLTISKGTVKDLSIEID